MASSSALNADFACPAQSSRSAMSLPPEAAIRGRRLRLRDPTSASLQQLEAGSATGVRRGRRGTGISGHCAPTARVRRRLWPAPPGRTLVSPAARADTGEPCASVGELSGGEKGLMMHAAGTMSCMVQEKQRARRVRTSRSVPIRPRVRRRRAPRHAACARSGRGVGRYQDLINSRGQNEKMKKTHVTEGSTEVATVRTKVLL